MTLPLIMPELTYYHTSYRQGTSTANIRDRWYADPKVVLPPWHGLAEFHFRHRARPLIAALSPLQRLDLIGPTLVRDFKWALDEARNVAENERYQIQEPKAADALELLRNLEQMVVVNDI